MLQRLTALACISLLSTCTGSGGGGGGCPVGSESCPCTDGEGCDPGLECRSDVCVAAGDADTDTDTDTDTDSDSDTDTGSASDTDTGSAEGCDQVDCGFCERCIQEPGGECADESTTCLEDALCACFVECFINRGVDRPSCEAECGAGSADLFDLYVACLCVECSTTCNEPCGGG